MLLLTASLSTNRNIGDPRLMSQNPDTILRGLLSKSAPPRTTLISSPDALRRTHALRHFECRFTSANARSSHRGGEVSLSQLRLELFSLSLFEPASSLLVVRRAHELPLSLAKGLSEELMKARRPHTPIIFESEPLATTHPIAKLAASLGATVAYLPLKEIELIDWVLAECKARGITKIANDAAQMLAKGSDGCLDTIANMIEVCALSLEPDEPLTVEACSLVVKVPPAAKEFALVDALAAKNRGTAEALLSTLLAGGVSPFPLVSLIAKIYGTYLSIQSMRARGIPEGVIQTELGLQPWAYRKQREAAARMSTPFLRSCYRAILTADSKLKNRSLSPELVMSELISKLVAAA